MHSKTDPNLEDLAHPDLGLKQHSGQPRESSGRPSTGAEERE